MLIPLAAWVAEACRLYVLATLLVAVGGKARDLRGVRASVIELAAVPERLAGPAAAGVIGAEAGLAVGLALGGGWSRAALLGALLLFALFAALIGQVLARGRRASCSCFGPSGRPVGAADLLRSGSLVAACAVALGLPDGARPPVAAQGLLFLAVLAAVLASVWLQARPPAPAGEGLVGRPIPGFSGRTGSNADPVGPDLFHGRPGVLVFVAEGCPKCQAGVARLRAMLDDMARSGVALWIAPLGLERRDYPAVTADPRLSPYVLRIPLQDCRRLNPDMAVPWYLFVDHEGVVQAAGLIGDADWESFAGQVAAEAA